MPLDRSVYILLPLLVAVYLCYCDGVTLYIGLCRWKYLNKEKINNFLTNISLGALDGITKFPKSVETEKQIQFYNKPWKLNERLCIDGIRH